MDAYFRRVMYLDDIDVAPIASILYVSDTMPQHGEDLLIIGTARDGDHVDGQPTEDIADYEWTDTYGEVTTVIEDDDNDPKRLNYPVRNLQPGWHTIGFKAADKGGKWSPGTSVNVLVLNSAGSNVIFIPLSNR